MIFRYHIQLTDGNFREECAEFEEFHVPRRSFVYICPACGAAWARADCGRSWLAQHVLCDAHESKWPWEVPGSIWLPGDDLFNESFNSQIMAREVGLHIRHAARLGLFNREIAA